MPDKYRKYDNPKPQRSNIVLSDYDDLAKISGKNMDERAKETARALSKVDRLKTAQIRNIYASIGALRTRFQKEGTYAAIEDALWLLKPKMAYAAGRQKAVNDTLFPFMDKLISAVDTASDKDIAAANFFIIIESVVGYHKFFESGNNIN